MLIRMRIATMKIEKHNMMIVDILFGTRAFFIFYFCSLNCFGERPISFLNTELK